MTITTYDDDDGDDNVFVRIDLIEKIAHESHGISSLARAVSLITFAWRVFHSSQ